MMNGWAKEGISSGCFGAVYELVSQFVAQTEHVSIEFLP